MQQKRAVDGLRTLGSQLQSMASNSDQDGLAGEMVRRASSVAEQTAGWLEERQTGDLVNEVRDYARERPVVFLAGAVVAGLLVGRLTRNVASAGDEGGGQGDGHRPGQGQQPEGMPPAAPPRLGPAADQAAGAARLPGSEVHR
ncbi:hypothetical protein [Micromonospora fluostatini]|uniref:hypothetical protein n=1 Tax=Micromonospora sp. JCM 30529 TaxID=3421643 RepID=UPI003D16EAD9